MPRLRVKNAFIVLICKTNVPEQATQARYKQIDALSQQTMHLVRLSGYFCVDLFEKTTPCSFRTS